jgi:outer membrane protein TolC
MSRQAPPLGIVVAVLVALLTGCHPQEPFYLKNVDNDLRYWKGEATDIAYPDVTAERLPDVADAIRPLSLLNRDTKNVWELTLEEAMQIALKNNKVMRNIGGQVQGPPEFILRNPELVPTIYDPALAESNPRTGTEAALSAFDAQLQTSLTWEKQDTPENVRFDFTGVFPNVNQSDLGTFQARLQKTAATGGTFAMTHSVAYDKSNNPTQLYSSDWNVRLVAEMRQPLLQGAGTQFNRIAGPGAVPGVFTGVMLARINTDVALADFEMSVQSLVSDVEIAYWELYFSYQSLGAIVEGRDGALDMWRRTYSLFLHGAKRGSAAEEASTRNQYYIYRSQAEQSLNSLYANEAKLRYLLGLAATDGRLIRPKDEPTTAKVSFDWCDVLSEGLVRSVALRQEKWIVKRRELELVAAKNFLLPKLDFVAQYRWLGMGNRLDGANSLDLDTPIAQDSNAYRTLVDGQYQEWQLGFQGQLNLGLRREMAGVRNAQLALTKEQVKLQEGELELSHQLAFAIRDLEANYVLTETAFNRRQAAQKQLDAYQTMYQSGMATGEEGVPILNDLLRAQQDFSSAENEYFRALVNYNRSIAQVHLRKGSLLEYNGVYLAEGPWPGKAYFDARRRSRARAASTPLDYGFTQPRVISRGPVEQHAEGESAGGGLFQGGAVPEGSSPVTPQGGSAATPPQPEAVPAPSPEPVPSDAVPSEPPMPEPMAEPPVRKPAATTGSDRAPVAPAAHINTAPAGSTRNGRDGVSGWKAAPGRTGVARTVDRMLLPAGWTVAAGAGSHEAGENPAAAASDGSASGWKAAQR